MAKSFFGSSDYVVNNYRHRKLGDGHLVTNDYGSWVYLDENEFKSLLSNNIKEPLFSILKEKGILLDKDNVDRVVEEYRTKCAYMFQGPSLHIVVPTLRCNMKCVYCHAKAKPENSEGFDMSKETAKKTIEFIMNSPSPAITIEFQGGEPLLRFDLIKYMTDYALELNKTVKKSLKFSVVTNLVLMKDEYFNYFKSNSMGICTSLDGHAEVHNKNRGHHAIVKSWIKKVISSYTINAMLLTTKHSLKYPTEVVDEYASIGLPKIWIKPVNRLAFADENWKKIGLTSESYLEYWRKAIDHIVKLNKNRKFIENYTQILLRKIMTKECVNFTDLESPCGAVIGQLAYSYDGKIYTCDEGRLYDIFNLGTVDDSYEKIAKSTSSCAIVTASINDNPVCDTCAYKPYCGLCPVCSYAETGNVITKLPDRRCRILIGMFDYIVDKMVNDDEYNKVFSSWLK